jgi:hypothetical protein
VKRNALAITIALVVILVVPPVSRADGLTLEECSAAIERVSTEPDGVRVVVGHLSRKLGISVDTLRTQRMQTGLGWGDLLIANRLSTETGVGLDQIVGELRNGKHSAEIAGDHKVDVTRLTTDVQESQDIIEHRSEDQTPHTNTLTGPAGRSGGGGRGHRGNGPARR